MIQSGEECLVHGLFTTAETLYSKDLHRSHNDDQSNWLLGVDYVKLRDGRGWIATKSSSGELLFQALRKRGDSSQTLQSQSSSEIRGVQGNSMYRKKVSL